MKLLIAKTIIALLLIPVMVIGIVAVAAEYIEKWGMKIVYWIEDLSKKIKMWGSK